MEILVDDNEDHSCKSAGCQINGQHRSETRKCTKKAEPKIAEGVDPSNLSLIAGIGPTLEKKLRAAGVTSWNEIAAWTEADIAKFDAELKLGGRATRDEWVEQAKELLAGKPPRAKVDKAEQASGEDK